MEPEEKTVLEQTNDVVEMLRKAIDLARQERWVAISITNVHASGESGHGAIGNSTVLVGAGFKTILELAMPQRRTLDIASLFGDS